MNEDIFFLVYHLGLSVQSAISMKDWERKTIIEMYVKYRGKR